jgi:hypothetical protein
LPWIKLDDHFDEHEKFLRAGPVPTFLWLRCLAYCNRNLTDGFIPYRVAMERAWSADPTDPKELIDTLLEIGLWELVEPHGYRMHDYLEYQPSRQTVLRERQSARDRMGRLRSGEHRANSDRSSPTPVPVPVPDTRTPGRNLGGSSTSVPLFNAETDERLGRVAPESVPKSPSRFRRPTLREVAAYCQERNNRVHPQEFLDHYEANGWVRGKTPIKDWKACVRTWERSRGGKGGRDAVPPSTSGGVAESRRAEELTREAKRLRSAGKEAEAQDCERKAEIYAQAAREAQHGGRR